jgi:cobaltochelatase CobN
VHILNAQAVAPDDTESAVDLDQTPGDIVVLSAADSELACLAAAQARRPPGSPTLRLANLLRLGHPLSVDLYAEQVIAGARLVVVRLLGGRSYWSYGVEQIAVTCRAHGIPFAALPGDDRTDPDLQSWSTADPATCERLWRYLCEGGLDNARQLLAYAASLLGRDEPWREPAPLLHAGLYLPGTARPDLDQLRAGWTPGRPRAAIVFYRALVQAGDLAPIDALIAALAERELDALPIYVTSLKDRLAAATVEALLAETAPLVVLNATGFALGSPGDERPTPLDRIGRPVLQVVLAGSDEAGWHAGSRGLAPRDLAMSVALPEIDGRVLARAIAFKAPPELDPATQCGLVRYRPLPDRIGFTADLAAAWARLAETPAPDRRIGLILANYPNRDGRIANGVGLDTPASAVNILRALAEGGYQLVEPPADGAGLVDRLLAGVTNELAGRADRLVRVRLDLDTYRGFFGRLPRTVQAAVTDRWGAPETDPHVIGNAFALALLPLGNLVVGLQPARGYQIDPAATYHSPDLVPPHGYLAFYAWLREVFDAHAVIHLGKHGNLEWLPGKALALSQDCFPEVALGPLPHLYPFIVNDPGEGSQAKRRASAVIVDHLTPPLTRAESHGPYLELEQRVDEYAEAVALDPRRAGPLRAEILERARALGLDRDLGLDLDHASGEALAKLDNHLCELKELQIRDGLHILGEAPAGEPRIDLLTALVRVPRAAGEGADASILRALAADLGLAFDPLSMDLAASWDGPRPEVLAEMSDAPWRTAGDAVERLELMARSLIGGLRAPEPGWEATRAVLATVEQRLRPALEISAAREIASLLDGLDGRFVAPGPSGAPTRGRPDVLPTGRNFFSVDTRAVPTPAAWRLGWQSAALLVERYLQEQGDWPRTVALSAWGTANMRTGGDDLAQALALLGVQPVWDPNSHRVTGIEVLPLTVLDRPRVDVTLRVSGFFRDAFPAQIELIDRAVRAVAALDEPDEMNPLAAHARADAQALEARGIDPEAAKRRATYRVFGSKPGAYGAGLQALIDERGWQTDTDLARAYVAWGGYAYGSGSEGEARHELFERRLQGVELVLHNQDNREHDLLDSDDYYQFEGGLTAAVRELSGEQPATFHNDHSRPELPRIRTLKEEIGRIVRGRAANPKWIRGVMRHGYKGAFEIAATVDYLFAFAATARVVEDHHFEAVFEAYLGNEEVRTFMAEANPAALRETAQRFEEAIGRGLWHPHRNDVADRLARLTGTASLQNIPGGRSLDQ